MNENEKDFDTVEEEYEFLDTVEFENETYFLMTPATDSDEIDGEVYVMKLVEIDGEEIFLKKKIKTNLNLWIDFFSLLC